MAQPHENDGDGRWGARSPTGGGAIGEEMKVFGIGLSRSGSMALNKALRILGYRSLFVLTYAQLEKNLMKYDAFTHVPLATMYRELDSRFPDSKFILNVRDQESWLRSCEKWWAVTESARKTGIAREIPLRTYGTDRFDREIFRRVYDRHLNDVTRHFAGRERSLLILDICGGEGFEKLCPFLGKSVPTQPFPHENSARATFERRWYRLKRYLVQHTKAREVKRFLMRSLGRN